MSGPSGLEALAGVMPPQVSVLIVNFNAGDHLRRCLDSVERQDGVSTEVVVVDNASTDGSLAFGERPSLRLLRNARNIGFGPAVNAAARASRAPFLLVLNPDCLLTPGALAHLLREVSSQPGCAVVGPGVVNEDGSYQGSARSDPTMFAGLFGRSSGLTRWFPGVAVRSRQVIPPSAVPDDATSIEVEWVSGACMLIARDAFDRCGGFDEHYFLFWEDADLCRRLRQLGFSVRFSPGARVVHSVGVSRRRAEVPSVIAFHRSAERYYLTHVAPSRWSPARWLAVGLLRARCAALVAVARRRARRSSS